MTTKNYLLIHTDTLSPVKQPGLSSPKNALDYHDPRVQEYLAATFSNIFPQILQSDEGLAYQLLDDRGIDRCSRAVPAQDLTDVPKCEMLKLMEGWIRLRRRIQDVEMSSRVKAILLNLRVPDPKKSIENYRLEKIGDQTKVIILWGFESKDAPCISLERALAYFLDVPVEQLKSILSTSMTQNTGAVTASATIERAIIDNSVETEELTPQRKEKSNKLLIPLILVSTVLLAAGVFIGAPFIKKEKPRHIEIPPIVENLTEPEAKTVVDIGTKKIEPEKKDNTTPKIIKQPVIQPKKVSTPIKPITAKDMLGSIVKNQDRETSTSTMLKSMRKQKVNQSESPNQIEGIGINSMIKSKKKSTINKPTASSMLGMMSKKNNSEVKTSKMLKSMMNKASKQSNTSTQENGVDLNSMLKSKKKKSLIDQMKK